MKKITSKVSEYFEYPEAVNLLKFCEKYIELSEIFIGYADEDELKAIEDALHNVMVRYKMGDTPERFKGLSINEIKNIFYKNKINILNDISENDTVLIKNKLNQFIYKNIIYARKLKMAEPITKKLSNEDYYNNYIIAQENLPALTLKAEKGLKK